MLAILLHIHPAHAREQAVEALRTVGLADRLRHRPSQLSGGQCQRVAIARAIAAHPDLLLADEPTGNLDSRTGDEIMRLFQSLNERGRTLLIVSHSQEIASLCRRCVSMKDGRIV